MNEVKPGWKTSEFWLHLLSHIPAVLAIFFGDNSPFVLGLGALSSIFGLQASKDYSEKRSSLKSDALHNQLVELRERIKDPLTPVAADPIADAAAKAMVEAAKLADVAKSAGGAAALLDPVSLIKAGAAAIAAAAEAAAAKKAEGEKKTGA